MGVERAHRGALGVGWPDDRADGEFAVEQDSWLGHDQVGLQELALGVEVGEGGPVVGSVSGGAFPALSCHVWKCMVSVGPMLSGIRSTSVWVTPWLLPVTEGARTVPGARAGRAVAR